MVTGLVWGCKTEGVKRLKRTSIPRENREWQTLYFPLLAMVSMHAPLSFQTARDAVVVSAAAIFERISQV